MSAIIVDFNPRSHERSDTLLATQLPTISISIHAPTRGATSVTAKATTMSLFQSTLPREERLHTYSLGIGGIKFQSTLPREERQDKEENEVETGNFNPRSHERSDAPGRYKTWD